MKDWRIAPPDNLTDGLGIGDGTKPTNKQTKVLEEMDTKIKTTTIAGKPTAILVERFDDEPNPDYTKTFNKFVIYEK